MSRIRTNNVFGTSTNNPLLVAGTTLNSAGLANLAAVAAPDVAVLTLDPNRVNGAPEIIHVTAHTGSATSATILRGQEGTAAREHPSGTFWVHAATITDWGTDWAAYVPSNTNVTVGNGTQTARFARVGNIIFWRYELAFGSTTAFSGTVQIGMPANGPVGGAIGSAVLIDANGNDWGGSCRSLGSQFRVHVDNNAASVNATVPFTWATSDSFECGGSYEAV